MKIQSIKGLKELWSETKGDSEIRIAILDGQVDKSHPCFKGAKLDQESNEESSEINMDAPMVQHGTHVASIVFGQHDSKIKGVAPNCSGTLVPIFSDDNRSLSQLDLARAIESAIESGAHIINVSGGQLSESGEAESWLKSAAENCQKNNVLLVAAAGNNGCECLHVPASLPDVLAVGAMDADGEPMEFSNWGKAYSDKGVLAPGKDILGAFPNGEVSEQSGTSMAAPIVSGVAALLLSIQIKNGHKPDPNLIREILLDSVTPCDSSTNDNCQLFLAGKLNINQALKKLNNEVMSNNKNTSLEASACECENKGGKSKKELEEDETLKQSANVACATEPVAASSQTQEQVVAQSTAPVETAPAETTSVEPSNIESSSANSKVFALGVLGYDFGNEARRDAFKQLMEPHKVGKTSVPANPYDARQMVKHFKNHLSETKSVIWTLNLELTPIYAIEGEGPFARDVYEMLVTILSNQLKSETDPNYVERVCIPGVLTGKTVTLFSGQTVPVIRLVNNRGIYGWKVNDLVVEAAKAFSSATSKGKSNAIDQGIQDGLRGFLEKIYYNLQNLGVTSQDRAMNYAATNAFQATHTFADSVVKGMELDDIQVQKSPFARMDSDCWDVMLKFFNPKNNQEAKRIYRFTIDVSETIPVTVGKVRSWSSSI